jgi:hypothetical protein
MLRARVFDVVVAMVLPILARSHGAVSRPVPRMANNHFYCPWCIGGHFPSQNRWSIVNHSTVPTSPCMGTSRGAQKYPYQNWGPHKKDYGDIPTSFSQGQTFETTIVLNADHNGDAQWQICPWSQPETESCFRQNRLDPWTDVYTLNGGQPCRRPNGNCHHDRDGQAVPQNVTIPANLPTGRATLRWVWVCRWTDEVFVSCIDIDVVSGGGGNGGGNGGGTGGGNNPTPATPTRRRRSIPTPTRRRRLSGNGSGCCTWGGLNGQCGRCGNDGSDWCHRSAANCEGACQGQFDPSGTTPTCGGGCCKWGGQCGNCGTDGSGWCHQSEGNCGSCSGNYDASATTPTCGRSAIELGRNDTQILEVDIDGRATPPKDAGIPDEVDTLATAALMRNKNVRVQGETHAIGIDTRGQMIAPDERDTDDEAGARASSHLMRNKNVHKHA